MMMTRRTLRRFWSERVSSAGSTRYVLVVFTNHRREALITVRTGLRHAVRSLLFATNDIYGIASPSHTSSAFRSGIQDPKSQLSSQHLSVSQRPC
jgi:hypothetical protein